MDAIEMAAFRMWSSQVNDYLPKSLARTLEGWRDWDDGDKEKWKRLAREALSGAFASADSEDWKRLDGMIDDSGHGRFWQTVFSEIRNS